MAIDIASINLIKKKEKNEKNYFSRPNLAKINIPAITTTIQ